MVYVAAPEPFNVPVPRVVAPFKKVTVPVGAGTPEAPVTVAVKVTLDPTAMEFAEAVRAVVVEPSVTLTIKVVEVDPGLWASPP